MKLILDKVETNYPYRVSIPFGQPFDNDTAISADKWAKDMFGIHYLPCHVTSSEGRISKHWLVAWRFDTEEQAILFLLKWKTE